MDAPVIDLAFKPEEAAMVSRLAARYGGSEEDTPEEIATRLAAMALMLSNISAAHLVALVDGEQADLGVGFAVEGGYLAADIEESLIAPAYRYQERWERNLLHTVDADTPGHPCYNKPVKGTSLEFYDAMLLPGPRARRQYALIQKQGAKAVAGGTKEPVNSPDEASAGNPNNAGKGQALGQPPVQPPNASPGPGVKTQAAEVIPPPKPDVVDSMMKNRDATVMREALGYRVFLADATTNAGFEKRATQAHLGRLMIHSSIVSHVALERTGKTLEEFTHHKNIVRGDATLTLRADPVLCVGPDVLNEAVMSGALRAPGLNRLLWLVESAAGCDLPDTRKEGALPAPIFQNFRLALEIGMKRRINFTNSTIQELPALSGELTGWRLFLRERERHSPGITKAVGNLPFALCYGLGAMLTDSSKLYGDEVVAFSKWLVIRMSNRLATASSRGQDSRIQRLAIKLANKLVTFGPMPVSILRRRCYKLKTADCRQALNWLAERQIATHQDDVWGIRGDSPSLQALLASDAN